ncbi:hypothetical protein ACS0TY_024556 [Phlomoides rotata]
MNSVSRRTRSNWDEFYRNKCGEKKKRVNGDCDKSGEKNIEYSYFGSHVAGEKIEYCNVGGEKLDLEKKRWKVDAKVVSVDDLEKMNGDDVCIDSDYKAGEGDGVKLEENKNDEGYDYVNTEGGDKELFSISRSSDRKRSGDKIIRIEEKELCSVRRCNKKEETSVDAANANAKSNKGCEWLEKQGKKREDELIKILVDSINAVSTVEKNNNILPTRFRFEDDEVVPPPEEKSEWEQHIDSLFHDLEFGLPAAVASKWFNAMLDPIVHVHKGTILDDHLPGLRHTIVFLHPTECQKAILEEASSEVKNVFRRIRLVSMVSVHPSLKAATETSRTDEVEQDVDAGVKMKFLLKLVWLADALGERVLIFSQFLDPLTFIMKQMECHLSWREGREVLYMDGQLDDKQRQDSISSFNNSKSEAKVLLASQRACSEGINLVGASRVVLLDTVWNPSMEKQAVSRAYRLGQKKIVHVYRLFTSGVEVRQFAQQIKKVKISEVIFSGGDGQACRAKNSSSEDKLMEAMLDLQGFNAIFEKVIYQPEESHLIDIFGLEGQN